MHYMEVSVQFHAAAVLDSMLTLQFLLIEGGAFITPIRRGFFFLKNIVWNRI
jgi:hypothetical protein